MLQFSFLMKLKILVINTGHFIVINSCGMLYTGINFISLTCKPNLEI